ncbi:MAG: glycosyltransferase family 2 protein [Thermoleophilaceae bacterium]|nr:glycosyltransferase family 2 protein [Thermoleophilaceae bacterium]
MLEIVIVVSDGARDHVRACLESLRRFPLAAGPMVTHVIDNASSDGTAEMIRDEFDEVQLQTLPWNSGFCIANNVVLRRAKARYVLLLNPDTEVTQGALDFMIQLMEQRPEIGMSSCRLVQHDGTFDHAAKRSFPTPLGALGHFTGLGRRASSEGRLAQYRAPELDELDSGEVDAVNGAFMLVRDTALRDVGLLDEGYWLYMDDLDWCYRFKLAGWKVWYDGSVTCIHVKGGTTVEAKKRGRHRGLKHNLAFHRSMGRFYRKFYAGKRPAFDALIYVAIMAKFLVAAVRSTGARRRVF